MGKSKGVSYFLWLFSLIGICGLNRFYIGKFGTGLLFLLTFGLFGIGIIYDLFTIPSQVDKRNFIKGVYVGGGYRA